MNRLQNFKFAFIASFILLLLSSHIFAAKDVVNSYWIGKSMSVTDVKSTLMSHGFTVVASHNVSDNVALTTIIFTCDELQQLGSKKGKGFASVLNVLVNDDKKEVKIQNPEYFLHAYMQKSYKEGDAKAVLTKIQSAFGDLKKTEDGLDKDDLAGYHFMVGMPYYEDEIVIGEGTNDELLHKYEAKVGDKHLYTQKLKNGSYLLGVTMGKAVEKFVTTIGEENAVLLPYTILIEDEKAKILHPKFYIALSYPRLSMGEFMKIRSTPGKIEDELEKYFQ